MVCLHEDSQTEAGIWAFVSLGVTQRLSTPWMEKRVFLSESPSESPVWMQGWGGEPPSDS